MTRTLLSRIIYQNQNVPSFKVYKYHFLGIVELRVRVCLHVGVRAWVCVCLCIKLLPLILCHVIRSVLQHLPTN